MSESKVKEKMAKEMADHMKYIFENSGMMDRPAVITLDEMILLAKCMKKDVEDGLMDKDRVISIRDALLNITSVGILADKPLESYGYKMEEFSPLFEPEKKSSIILPY